jgi:hypothetical protein
MTERRLLCGILFLIGVRIEDQTVQYMQPKTTAPKLLVLSYNLKPLKYIYPINLGGEWASKEAKLP